jgi:peptidoglycan/xylan/chitin deacetylase (PgdA/CDA1 family)
MGAVRKNHSVGILFYHRFSSRGSEESLVSHLDAREFRKQIRHVKRWYRIVDMDQIARELEVGTNFRSPAIAITIDDGYVNNFTDAYPVIRDERVPALIYLTTGFIGTTKATWVDDLMDVILNSREKQVLLSCYGREECYDLSTRAAKKCAFRRLFRLMLYLEHDRKERLLAELAEKCGAHLTGGDCGRRRMLNWEEVAEMAEHGVRFGAHTVRHVVLTTVERNRAKEEILQSRVHIEARMGTPVEHFAVPNGKEQDFSPELREYCREIGMKTVVSTEAGVVCARSDPYWLPRVLPPPPIYVFACELARYMFVSSREGFKSGVSVT